MSYADAASHYTPPGQPQPNPALLNTDQPSASLVADDSAKVGIVAPDFKQHPQTTTSEFEPPTIHLPKDSTQKKSGKSHANRGPRGLDSKSAAHWASVVKEVVLRPAVAGGLLGVVNVGIIGYTGYTFYSEPHLRRNPQAISAAVVGSVALLGLEGFGAEKFRQEEQGKDDAAVVAQYFHENPGMFQGLLGVLNVGILGTTGYVTYSNWDRWDRRTVSAVTGGLFCLWAGEGYLLSSSRQT